MLQRLCTSWVYGGFLAGFLMLALVPLLLPPVWPAALLAVYLQLPIYMLHQFEEHDQDRFRAFFNRTIGKGREVLSPEAVFVINVPGVWGVIAASLLLARFVSPGLGLIAIYLTLMNAAFHIMASAVTRAYNPGLVTAIVMFLPAGLYGLREVNATGVAGWPAHALGVGIAVAIHVAIVAYARVRLQRGPVE
jgi:Protein of unknown function with HXXEE motif